MGRFRVYITPFEDDGSYASEVEVTNDVVSLGNITQRLDQNEYQVGIRKTSDIGLVLRNDHGKYGKAGDVGSIFHWKRNESKVRVTWHPRPEYPYCGWFSCDEWDGMLGEEKNIFLGILSDIGSKTDLDSQMANFKILGKEHILSLIEVPYANVSNGNSVSDLIGILCAQTRFNSIVTVANGNFNLGFNFTINDKASFENKRVEDVLKDLMVAANSVLYVENDVLIADTRDAHSSLAASFYGPSSEDGLENIIDIKNYRNGENRIINHATWADTTLVKEDTSSQDKHGVRTFQIDFDAMTDTTNRNTILQSWVDEFKNEKREFDLMLPLSLDNLDLVLLDKISIDYPALLYPEDDFSYYDFSDTYDSDARYAFENQVITIESTARFKIMGKMIDTRNEIMVLELREA